MYFQMEMQLPTLLLEQTLPLGVQLVMAHGTQLAVLQAFLAL
jgi:hypothetical protein